MRKVVVIDLFSGSGGWSSGFARCVRATFEPTLAIDSNKWAIGSFKENFPSATALRLKLDPATQGVTDAYRLFREYVRASRERRDEVVIVASPPCEPFSDAAATLRTSDDARLQLFRSVLAWVGAVHPVAVFVENVPQMQRLHGGAVDAALREGLSVLGYVVDSFTLNAADYGVPQLRRRLFYVAYRGDLRLAPDAPPRTHTAAATNGDLPYVTVSDAIADLPVRAPGQMTNSFVSRMDPDRESTRVGYYASAMRAALGQRVYHHWARPLDGANLKRVRMLSPGEAMEDLPPRLRPKMGFPGSYGRLAPDEPAPTLTAHFNNPGSGRNFHYAQPRVITLREGARLQGFGDGYRWSGYLMHIAEQIGDAVPPPLAHTFAHELAGALIGAGVIEPSDASGDRHCVFRHVEVPHAQHLPAERAKGAVRATVA